MLMRFAAVMMYLYCEERKRSRGVRMEILVASGPFSFLSLFHQDLTWSQMANEETKKEVVEQVPAAEEDDDEPDEWYVLLLTLFVRGFSADYEDMAGIKGSLAPDVQVSEAAAIAVVVARRKMTLYRGEYGAERLLPGEAGLETVQRRGASVSFGWRGSRPTFAQLYCDGETGRHVY